MKSIFYHFLILAVLILLVLLGSSAFSQNKFALSATVAPFIGHSKFKVLAMMPDPKSSAGMSSQVLRSEVSPKGFWAGLNGKYSFSEKWSASTGLWLNYSVINQPVTISRDYHFSIPVIANLQTSERKLSPYFSAGALWNFGTTSRMTLRDYEQTVIFKSGRNTSRISPLIGAGVIYHFAEHLSLVVQPVFSYAIPPSNINTRAYQLILNAQLMLRL